MKQEESQSVEYKRSWHDEYLRWVCGFANAKGGTLWIGIDDEKRIFGVENARKLMEDVFDRLDYMEREGSGFKKIMLAYSPDFSHNQKGLAPKFYSAVGCFVVTLPNLNGSASVKSHGGAAPEARVGQKGRSERPVRKVGQKNRSERTRRKLSDRIVALMGKQPGITQQAMVAELGVARSTIILHISALKDSGRIRRVGPDKGGHWEVVT